MRFFFITTEHLEDRLWFRDDEDYKVGMNYVAIISYALGIKVIAFILMSNHVHFLIICRCREEAELFINKYKTKYSMYYQRKYGTCELLRRNAAEIEEISVEGESLERIIAYIQMNSVAANICLNASGYPWGTGDCFFRVKKMRGICTDTMSAREKARKLHSTLSVPSKWIYVEDGYIDPASFVETDFVEKLFRTPKRMNYFLLNSSKAKKKMANNESNTPSFRDQLVNASIPDLCRSLFLANSIKELNEEQTAELVKQIRTCFRSDVNQISRVTGLPYSDVARMLDRY